MPGSCDLANLLAGIFPCSISLDTLIALLQPSVGLQEPPLCYRPPFPAGALRLVDLRDRNEFEESHIPGSTHLAFAEIDLPYLRPPRRRPLILLGKTADQAYSAAQRFHSRGYTALPLDAPVSQWPGPWISGEELAPVWEPSPMVAKWTGRLPPDRVVDLACGSGRDAVYLAIHGAEVTGIDILQDALDQAESLALRHRVPVRLIRANLESDDEAWAGPWSTIVVQRFLHRRTFSLFSNRLKHGGYLLYETFHQHQYLTGRRPRSRHHLLESGELIAAAIGLSLTYSHERVNENGDWVASLVARKGDAHGK